MLTKRFVGLSVAAIVKMRWIGLADSTSDVHALL